MVVHQALTSQELLWHRNTYAGGPNKGNSSAASQWPGSDALRQGPKTGTRKTLTLRSVAWETGSEISPPGGGHSANGRYGPTLILTHTFHFTCPFIEFS